MKLLLIDTCGAQGSVAIADTGPPPAPHLLDGDGRSQLAPAIVHAVLPGRSASEKLVATVRDLAQQSGVALRHLDAIAVVHGPGSFTGVRVGVSAAKGFCEALDLPLIAISRLAVLASAAGAKSGARVFAALDAGRGELYLGEYLCGVRLHESLIDREDLRARVAAHPEGVLVVCQENVSQLLAGCAPTIVSEPDAATAMPFAFQRFTHRSFDDAATLDANYLRRTDLEIAAKVNARAAASAAGSRP